MKKNILNLFLAAVLVVVSVSCKRKGEVPPVKAQGPSLTIAELKAIASCTNNCQRSFTTDTYLAGVVLADNVNGNFYKETFIRDATGAIHLTLKSAPLIFVGDSIRINMKGLSVGYNPSTSMLEVDSVDTDRSMVILGKGAYPNPKVLDMNQINTPNYFAGFLNDLVEIKGMGFASVDANQLYANINTTAQSRLMYSCGGDGITLRTNSYASFSGQKTPTGYGNIIGIATNFGAIKQLVIRNTTEWAMTQTTCVTPGLYLKKNFNDGSVTSGGWTMEYPAGSISWASSTLGSWANRPYAQISNYPSNSTMETWLISPALDLSSSTNPMLSFQNAKNQYTGNSSFQVMISTDYTSGLPATGTWTPLNFTASPGASSYPFVFSGNISLNAYKNAGVRIAFKYAATGTFCPTIEIDDIAVLEN